MKPETLSNTPGICISRTLLTPSELHVRNMRHGSQQIAQQTLVDIAQVEEF